MLLPLGTALDWLNAGDFVCVLEGPSDTLAVVGKLDLVTGVSVTLIGCECAAIGDADGAILGILAPYAGNGGLDILLLSVGRGSGGGGNGAIPILFLSLAAAAAAAEAYLRVSPGARVGTAAGFMLLFELPLAIFDKGVCNVARAGKGLFNCVDGLRAAATGGSEPDVDFDFPPGPLLERISVSGASSCIDCVS